MDVRIPSLAALTLLFASPVCLNAQQSTGYPTRSTTDNLSEKRYVAAGDRAYVVGVQDGTFQPIGWHISGTMGGVWSHPIKLLDSYSLSLGGTALPAVQKFTSGPGFVQLSYPATSGLQITRTEYSPDGVPVVLIGLQIQNPSSQTVTTTLGFQAVSQILPAYPWSGTKPTSAKLDKQDNVEFDQTISALIFSEPDEPWYAMVAGRATKKGPQDSVQFLGASGLGTGQNNEATGELSWQLTIGAGSTIEIWFGVSGTHVFKGEAYAGLVAGFADPDGLLSQKIQERVNVLALSNVTIPDQTAQDAFTWAKLNLADMSRTVLNAEIRDTKEGKVYRAPIAEFPFLSGFGAGYPDYPWFFGTDGSYTTFGLVATGQWDLAMNHLNLVRTVSQAVNGSTGKVLHEIVTDGSIYFGTNKQPGDSNETAEFASAVATVWRWSGDSGFLDQNYDFIKAGLKYLETTLDTYPDGWPEGAGMVEANGMGAKKLDVAVYTIRALNDLTEMATSKHDTATAQYEQALEIKPSEAGVHYNLANALLAQGQVDDAISHYQAALAINPDYADAHNNLGAVLVQKGEIDQAIDNYQKALEIDPQDVRAEGNLAWALAISPQTAIRKVIAVKLAEHANEVTGGANPLVLHILAATYAQSEQFSRAIETAERALELATTQNNEVLVISLQSELELYRSGQPYRYSK